MSLKIEDMEKFMKGQMEYWRQVDESEGFDMDGISVPQGTTGLLPFDCERDHQPLLVRLYARLGLHRYNMSKGTNFVFQHLKKYNQSMTCLSSYYITLVACDPATPTSLVTFQVGVGEKAYGRLYVMCFCARLQGPPKEPFVPLDVGGAVVEGARLPVWPSDFSDRNRFHILEESELQDNDWVRLYLELALCANDRGISDDSLLSQLQILKVAIGFDEAGAKSSTSVYITFKGLASARVGELGEHVERKVIVRRIIDLSSGCLTLFGGFGFSIGEEAHEQRPMSRPQGEWPLTGPPTWLSEDVPPIQKGDLDGIRLFDWSK